MILVVLPQVAMKKEALQTRDYGSVDGNYCNTPSVTAAVGTSTLLPQLMLAVLLALCVLLAVVMLRLLRQHQIDL